LGANLSDIKNDLNGVLSILCPTRERPEQLLAMIDSAIRNSKYPNLLEFCLYIDRDDHSYDSINFEDYNCKIATMRGNKMWLSGMYNSLTTIASGEFFFWSGDDVEFQTFGWDDEIRQTFAKVHDKLAVVHVNDMATSYPQIYATIGAVHLKWIQVFGYIFTPHMRDNGIDFWISDVARQVNRLIYLPHVKVEHKQYRQGKADFDETYLRRLEDHQLYNPISLYRKLKSERRLDALMLCNANSELQIQDLRSFRLSRYYLKVMEKISATSFSDKRKIYILSMDNKLILSAIFRKTIFSSRNKDWG
jgi:hypothetical protein